MQPAAIEKGETNGEQGLNPNQDRKWNDSPEERRYTACENKASKRTPTHDERQESQPRILVTTLESLAETPIRHGFSKEISADYVSGLTAVTANHNPIDISLSPTENFIEICSLSYSRRC